MTPAKKTGPPRGHGGAKAAPPRRRATALHAAVLVLLAAVGVGLLVRAAPRRHASGSGAATGTQPADAELTRLQRAAAGRADADSAIALGNAYAERGRWFSAIWAFQDALNRRPDDFTSRFSIGSALLLARLPAAAAEE